MERRKVPAAKNLATPAPHNHSIAPMRSRRTPCGKRLCGNAREAVFEKGKKQLTQRSALAPRATMSDRRSGVVVQNPADDRVAPDAASRERRAWLASRTVRSLCCPQASSQPSRHPMRQAIRAEVQQIQPLDALEHAHKQQTLTWIASGAALCRISKPATPPQHLVAYFAVIDGDHLLLVDHRNARLWLPTGGHVEPGEHPRDTVVRELKEELGLTPLQPIAAPLMITCTVTVGLSAGHTDVSLWYLVPASRSQPLKFDAEEFNAVRWFHRNEVPFERSDPHMRRFVAKLGLQQAV